MRIRWVAWGLWTTFVVVLLGAMWLGFSEAGDKEPIRVIDAIWASAFLGFPTSGALIASRLPRSPVGWIFLVAPLCIMSGVVLSDAAAANRTSTEMGAWWVWASNLLFTTGLCMLAFVPLLLPSGRLHSPRWRPVAALLWVAVGLWVLSAAFSPGALTEFPDVVNPLSIPPLDGVFSLAQQVSGPIVLGIPAIGLIALVLRPRRAEGLERQQLKWLALGASVIAGCFIGVALIENLLFDLSDLPVTLVMVIAILAMPVTITIAMLRHRLYDIDVIVNRTLVYGSLTAVLLGTYLIVVVTLSQLFDPFTQDSDVAVAASTLAVAALFGPLRSRMQAFIDRRFYRSRYDAALALQRFVDRLRDEVELDVVGQDLLTTVRGTIQPAHASLWLRIERGRS